jgi:Family of unknown function (DUF6448)
MPPHCDSLDGPVVAAAREALERGDATVVTPFVPADGETEVVSVFEQALAVRGLGREAQGVADRLFFETVVRVHRAGEGAPFTGLKPAGLDVGPVIPVAERAIEDGDADELVDVLVDAVESEVRRRLQRVLDLRARSDGDVAGRREYVAAMLGLQVWSHALYAATQSQPHEQEHAHAGV